MPATELVFDDFLESLRLQDFTISTGHYLRLHKLLARIGPDCKPQDVKTVLCPIIATNEREQERFYEQFDAYFNYESSIESGAETIESLSVEREPEENKPKPRKKILLALVLGLLSLVLVAIVLVILARLGGTPPPPSGSPTPTPTPTASISTPTPPALSFFLFRSLGVEPSTLRRILMALLPLIVFAIYEIYRRIRRRQRREDVNDRAQQGIPVSFGASLGDVYDADDLTRVARLLRARQRSGELQLDIVESVIATVRALGFFTLREKAVSKPPEYLVLIDRAAFRDHQARLFYELTHKLNAEGVFVTCYYFEGDPRVSFIWPFESSSAAPVVRTPEAQQKVEEEARRSQRGVTLEDLHDLYTDHRLLIFGEGTDLVDPLTLQTVDWIKSFTHWQDRAILTPRPPSLWDAHEFALSQQFVVMPATLRGVELAAESFAIREPVSIPENLRGDSSLPPHDIDSAEDLPELRVYLGERYFQWLCACAVHPQLQWDLTMVLGEQFSQSSGGGKPVESLFTEENLLRLFNLSWFRVGTIPEPVRERLMRQLTARSEATVRQTIAELREKAAASEISLESLSAVRVPLPQEFAGQVPVQLFQRFRELRDAAFKRFLQPEPLVLFFKNILPPWLQRLLFTPFGLRAGVRVALVVLASLLVWASYPTLASAFESATSANVNENTNVNVNTNVNANANASVTPIAVNTNANANANLSPSPTASPVQSPSLIPSPAPATPSPTPSVSFSPSPTPIPSVSLKPPPTPSTPTPTATPTPITTFPSPSPSASLPPNVGILKFEVRPATIAAGESTQVLFDIRQARNIRITPADGDLTDWNRRFDDAANRIRDFKQSARVRPPHTTTYTITADVIANSNALSFITVSQQATVTVKDDGKADTGCSPGRYNFDDLVVPNGSIQIAIIKSCSADGVERWTMAIIYIAGRVRGTYNANGDVEEAAMKRLTLSRILPSSFTNAFMREVYPVLKAGDSSPIGLKKIDSAIARALRYVN